MPEITINKLKKQINLFVPLNLNDGSPASPRDLQYIEDLVIAHFGTCTLHLPLMGVWTNPQGIRYRDQVMVIETIVVDQSDLVRRVIEIGTVVRELLQQEEVFFTIRNIDVISSKAKPSNEDDLTPREKDVLIELSKGLSNKGIGKVLFLEESTVEGHLNRIYRKLGVSSRAEAIVYALTHGIGQKN